MTAMLTTPTTDTTRDARGRFGKGNPGGGQGARVGSLVAQFRLALLRSVSVEDLQGIGQALAQKAKSGDLDAIKLLLRYLVGDPQKMEPPESAEETELERASRVRRLRELDAMDQRLHGA